MGKFNSTKFTLAGFFTVAAIVGLFADKLTGAEFVAAATLILGVYATSDVVATKIIGMVK